MKKRSVIWTQRAAASLDLFCAYIEADSISAAKKVRKEIVTTARSLSRNAEIYQLDEFLSDESQSIRRFFRWSYRVVYLVTEKEVVILNIYHTSTQSG